MIDPKIIDDISKKMAGSMPSGLFSLQDDMKRNLHSAIEMALRNMNLVSREEFDIQTAVLGRTRNKLEALEKRVAELEAALIEDPLKK